MEYQRKAERPPVTRRKQGADVGFDPNGIAGLGQSKQFREPCHVGVHREAGEVERDASDHVGRLSAYPRQADQVVHSRGHLAGEPPIQFAPEADEASCLSPKESSLVDDLFELASLGASKVGRGRVPGEQRRRDRIHPDICGLRRQHSRRQELERALERELAQVRNATRIALRKPAVSLTGTSRYRSRSDHPAKIGRPRLQDTRDVPPNLCR